MRGLKAFESTKHILEGYTVHYNYVRKHQSLDNKTPQAARMDVPNNWKGLIEQATKHEAMMWANVVNTKANDNKQKIEVVVK